MKTIQALIFTLFLALAAGRPVLAVEPDNSLFSENTEVREARYRELAQHLAGEVERAVDEQERQNFELQKQLLAKLRKLPEPAPKVSTDLGFSGPEPGTTIPWDDFRQFLDRYVRLLMETEVAERNLEDTDRQQQSLYSELIALDDQSAEQDVLQLQYGYQVRKSRQQQLILEQLKEGVENAGEQFPVFLQGVRLAPATAEKLHARVARARERLQQRREKQARAAAGLDAKIEQQESVVAGYLGRELTASDRKIMHYETLKLLEQQVHRQAADIELVAEEMALHGDQQKALWYTLFTESPDFFILADEAGDLSKQLGKEKEAIKDLHGAIYGYENRLAGMRGADNETGPMAKELIATLDREVQAIFTQVSGMAQQADLLLVHGRLLEKGIGLRQSSIGSVVTRTREATGNLLDKALAVVKHPLIAYSGMSVSLLLIAEVLGLLLLGIVANRLFGHAVLRAGRKRKWSERTIHLVHAAGKYPLIVVVGMITLSVVGINTRSLALVAGALSLGIGFGMQTIVNNLVSGIILLFDKSIRPGDFISLAGTAEPEGFGGSVVQMNIRATVLQTNDNINIIIPNADLMASRVVNWTYGDDRVRFRIPFNVAYGTDIDHLKTLVKTALLELAIVLPQPEPQVWMADHGDSSLAFLAAMWVEGQSARQPARTRDAVLTVIYQTLQAHDIEIPYPQVDLRLRSDEQSSPDVNGEAMGQESVFPGNTALAFDSRHL